MKPRKWLLLVCGAVLVLAFSLHQGLRHVQQGRHLEKILVAAVSPAVGGSFNVGRVELGFFSAYLRDVHVGVPARAFTFQVTDIKIGLSLWKLVATKGDLSRSIDKIILIDPRITFSLKKLPAPATPGDAPSGQSFTLDNFPVKYLLVKNGSVVAEQAGAGETVIADGLNGRLWDGAEGVEFEMKGCLAARQRNLSFSGVAARSGARSRISVRLAKARIGKPLHFQAFTIAAGTLDGTCEFTMDGAHSAAALVQASGWMRVQDGRIQGADGRENVTDIDCGLSMEGTRWMIDSLSARWRETPLNATASWDLSGKDSSVVTVSGRDIDIVRLVPQLPTGIAGAISGRGWASLTLVRSGSGPWLQAKMMAGGIGLLGTPLTTISAAGAVRIDSGVAVRFDTLSVKSPTLSMNAAGTVESADTSVAYHLCYELRLDTLPLFSGGGIGGHITARGNADGSEKLSNITIDAVCRDLRVAGVALGTQSFSAVVNAGQLNFWTTGKGGAAVMLSGLVDSLFSPRPRINGTISAGTPVLKPLLAAAGIDTADVDTLSVEGTVSGSLPMWALQASGRISMPGIKGGADLFLAPADTAMSAVYWMLNDRSFTVADSTFTFYLHGRLHNDSLVMDSLNTMNGLTGGGRLLLGGAMPADIRLRANRLSAPALCRWFAPGAVSVEDGVISGSMRITGPVLAPTISSEIHVRRLSVAGVDGLETDAVVTTDTAGARILPLVVRKAGRMVLSCDTVTSQHGRFRLDGRFEDVDIGAIITEQTRQEHAVKGMMSGSFISADSGFPVTVQARCSQLEIDTFQLDSVDLAAALDPRGIRVKQLGARDGPRSTLAATAWIPWSFLGSEVAEGDTLSAQVDIKGDLLASLEKNLYSPIAGTGMGEVSVSFTGTADGWHVGRSYARIPKGILSLYPFVLQKITDFTFDMSVDDSSRVKTALSGMIKKRQIRIYSTHDIPAGYEPIVLGPLDFGALLATSPKQGIEIHLPGFQEIKDPLDVEFSRKAPWPEFAVSGPFDRLKVTGTWLLHEGQFTFPFLDTREMPWPFDPFPFISWELDLRTASQNVMYFWDLQGKRRKLVRFVEAYLDPSSLLQVRGRDRDRTFRLLGNLRSYRGTVFFGRMFDRRFEVGLDFTPQSLGQAKGYENLPIMWGSAEAYSDSSRFETIKLTLQLTDPVTGGVSERGRLAMVPRVEKKAGSRPGLLDSIPNFIFHLSSDFDQTTGEAEREFYKETGLRFSSVEGAGEMVGDFGEQYLNRYFFQKIERGLARKLGLDVITIETSIASNYFNTFYNRQFSGLTNQWEQLALANLGVTVGRYFFHDNLFVKARGELIPQDRSLIPEYSLGLEVQPVRYLLMDFNYGVLQGEKTIEHNPQVNLQLRLPITRVRNFLHF